MSQGNAGSGYFKEVAQILQNMAEFVKMCNDTLYPRNSANFVNSRNMGQC